MDGSDSEHGEDHGCAFHRGNYHGERHVNGTGLRMPIRLVGSSVNMFCDHPLHRIHCPGTEEKDVGTRGMYDTAECPKIGHATTTRSRSREPKTNSHIQLFGFVASMTYENPYVRIPKGGSTLDAMERAKLLKDVEVCVGDVHGDRDIGHIAFSAGMPVRKLWRGRLYA